MPLPITPDPSFAAAATKLREQLLGLDKSLDSREFQAASPHGKIIAKVTGAGAISGLSIDPAVVISPPAGGLGPAIKSIVNTALQQARTEAREALAMLAAGMNLPGSQADRLLWHDVPGFRRAARDFRGDVVRVESEASASAQAADGKVEVKVSGRLEVVEIRLDHSLATSVDSGNIGAFVQTAANEALRDAQRNLACKEADSGAVFAAKQKPADDDEDHDGEHHDGEHHDRAR